MITKKFIRNSIIYTVAGSLPMASAIILLPFYLGYLSPSTLGALSIYMGISLLVQIFVTFSFDTSVYNYFHDYKHDKDRLPVFISTVFVFVLMIGGVTTLLLLLTGHWLFNEIFTSNLIAFYPFGLISVATGVFQALFKIYSSLLQTQERASEFLNANLISFGFIVLFTISGLYIFPDSLTGPLTGRMVAVGISVFILLLNIYRQYGVHFDLTIIRTMMGFNQSILVYQILQWLNLYFDRFLMSRYLPLASVGVYDIASKCLMGIEFVIVGFNGSFLPKVLGLVSLQNKKKSTVEINRYYNGLTAVTIILIPLSILCLPFILDLFVAWFNKPEYAPAVSLIPYLSLTYLFRTLRLYTSMPYGALKDAKALPLYYFVILAVKISVMIWFLNLWGVMGVIYAMWIGYALEVTILFWGIAKKFEFKFNAFKLVFVPIVFGVLIMVVEPFYGVGSPIVVHIGYLLAAGGLLLWAYKNELKSLRWDNLLK